MLGAVFLAFAITFPTVGEARLSAHQLEIPTECSPQLPGRLWIRGAGPCKGQVSVPSVLPQRMLISGKLGAALGADLYCRTSPTDISEFTRKATACLPHPPSPQRLIAASGDAVEWPSNRFDPVADTGMVEGFSDTRVRDG
jgi:hypothetical protein